MDKTVAAKTKEFFSKFRKRIYKKGEILIRADDDPSGIFLILEGYVKKYAISKKGEEVVVNLFKPGSFFPMGWAVNGSTNRYFYESKSPLVVLKAPPDEVIKFLKDNPEVLYDLLSRVYKGLDGLLMKIVYLMSGSAYSRMIAELIIYVRRFGSRNESTGETECKVSEKDLAAQSGLTRETVSRVIGDLKNKGLLKFHANILSVKDLNALENELRDDFNGLP